MHASADYLISFSDRFWMDYYRESNALSYYVALSFIILVISSSFSDKTSGYYERFELIALNFNL